MTISRSGLAATVALIVITGANLGLAAIPDVTLAQDEPTCTATTTYMAKSPTVIQGTELELELTASATCAEVDWPTHLVFVMDTSIGIQRSVREDMQAFAQRVVDNLQLGQHPHFKVSVVAFSGQARMLCDLTNDEATLGACIQRMDEAVGGGTRIDLGMAEGLRVLLRGRQDSADRDSIREVIILVSDGGNAAGCPPVLQASGQAQGLGVLVMTVCIGDCDEECMRHAASNPRYAFQMTDDHADYISSHVIESSGPAALRLRAAVITDTLAPGVSFVPGSANQSVSVRGQSLEWSPSTAAMPQNGVTLTFRVHVDAPVGRLVLSEGGLGRMMILHPVLPSDWITFMLPIPEVEVVPATPTPTLSPTPVPSSTPTDAPSPVYLPSLVTTVRPR